MRGTFRGLHYAVAAWLSCIGFAADVFGADNLWTGASTAVWKEPGNWSDPTSWQTGDVAVFGPATPTSLTIGLGGTSPQVHGMMFNAPGFQVSAGATFPTIALVDGGTNSLRAGEIRTNFDAVLGGRFQSAIDLHKTGVGSLTLGDEALHFLLFKGDVFVEEGDLIFALQWRSSAEYIRAPDHRIQLDGNLKLDYPQPYHQTQARVFNEQTTGPGRVTLTGTGHVAVNGDAWNHAGGTYINAGGLSVGSLAGQYSGEFFNNALLNLGSASSKDTTFSGTITGPGNVNLYGGGGYSLRLTGVNAPGGGTKVNGRVIVGDGAHAGSLDGSINVSDGATLEYDRADDLELVTQISGPGQVVKSGSGTTTFASKFLGTGEFSVRNGRAVLADVPTSSLLSASAGAELVLPATPGGFSLGDLSSNFLGMSMRGLGTIHGDVLVPSGRQIRPGPTSESFGPGTLTVNGDVHFLPATHPDRGGALNATIQGADDTDGSRSRLQVTGELRIDKLVLSIFRRPTYFAGEPAIYTIAEASSLVTPTLTEPLTFQVSSGGIGSERYYQLSNGWWVDQQNLNIGDVVTLRRTGNALQLAHIPGFAVADFDLDLDVDGVDLSTWKQCFGSSEAPVGEQGDTDGDGDVDGADFLRWQRAYNSPNSSVHSVPEARSAALAAIVIGLAAIGLRRESTL